MTSRLVATPDSTTSPPSVALVVAWPAATTVNITRRDPDGRKWTVRQAGPALLDGSGNWVGRDYEAGYGVALSYDMTSPDVPGVIVHVRAGVLSVPTRWQSALINPGAPALSVPVNLYSGTLATVTRPAAQGKIKVLGRPRLVVLTDSRQGASSQLVVYTETLAERDAVQGLLASGQTLRLACDPALELDVPQTYVQIGDVTEARVNPGLGYDPQRLLTLPFDEVDRPAGGYQAVWSCASVLAQYRTIVKVELAFATCADLVLDHKVSGASAWSCLAVLDSYSSCNAVKSAFPTCSALLLGAA